MSSAAPTPPAPRARDLRFPLLLGCFFLSGFAALLYETVWTRQLSFVFGTSELAVSAVLAAYMGGLALGAVLAARWARFVTRPVLTYGVLELVIGIGALAVPTLVTLARSLYLGWLGGLPTADEGSGWIIPAFQLASSFAVLAPCTIPMGATLPLLAKHAVTDDDELGPRIGSLYAANTAGAIFGTLGAAFILIPSLGLRSTVLAGAAINAAVFLGALQLARHMRALPSAPRPTAAARTRLGFHWVLPLMTASGAVSFAYEVLWFRLFGWVLGGSIAAFATMLASFLTGIFAGSAVASRWATSRANAMLGLTVAQLSTALFAWLAFVSTESLADLADALGAAPSNLAPGALLAGLLLFPMTISIGATFPFAVRIFARDADDASEASARVYGWNTVGSIIGSIGAGFVLLPALGYEGTLLLGVCANLALALALALAGGAALPASWPLGGIAVAALAAILVFPPSAPLHLLSSSPLGPGQVPGRLRAVLVGRSATVTLFEEASYVKMYTNGLPESGAPILEPTPQRRLARMLSRLPVLFHPEAREALVIGLGAGITLGAVPPSVERVEVIELEAEVVAANRLIPERVGGQPIDDPRVTVRVGDARGHLMLATNRYDVIVSQPSHPWTAGASHLYTREFFELLRDRLETDGIFSQWIGMRFVNADTFSRLVATMAAVFPHVQVFQPTPAGIVFLGRTLPFDDSAVARALALTPEVYTVEALHRSEDVLAMRRLDETGVAGLIEGVAPITDDDNPFAATREPTHEPNWLEGLIRRLDPLTSDPRVAGANPSLDLARLVRQISFHISPARAKALGAAMTGDRAELVRGWAAFDDGARPSAAAAFRSAHASAPDDASALAGLVISGAYEGDLEALPPDLRAIAEGLAAERARDWDRLEGLDAELARTGPADLLFTEAAQLRERWRTRKKSPDRARERFELVSLLYRERMRPAMLVDRADAAIDSGQPEGAVTSLQDFIDLRASALRDYNIRTRAQRLAASLPEGLHRDDLVESLSYRRRGADVDSDD